MLTESVPYHLAVFFGLASFFSPCVLPLIPAYFSFITGLSIDELTGARTTDIRMKVVVATLSYVSGFSVVFVLLGASASFVGNLIFDYKEIIIRVGGGLIIVFGVHLTGIIRIPGLDVERRLQVRDKPVRFFGAFLVGMAFAAGWSPCIGPQLASILIVASNQETVRQGVVLLGLYSLGLALPFLLMSVFINYLLVIFRKVTWAIRYFNLAAGGLLIAMGVLLMTGDLFILSGP